MTLPVQTDPLHAALVTNGSYRCLLSPAGTGFSSDGERQLTAWEGDPCEDDAGFYIYVYDPAADRLATASGALLPGQDIGGWRPGPNGVVLERSVHGVESTLRLEVLADAPVERRILRLHNPGTDTRQLELTSYVEVVLNDPAAHAGHPGFSKLFIETAWSPAESMLIASRRPRANGEHHPLLAMALIGAPVHEWETDRSRFLGRGRRVTDPQVLAERSPLSGRVGAVLDPVLALRTRLTIAPGATAELTFVLTVAADRSGLARHVALAASATGRAPTRALGAELLSGLTPPMAELYESYARGSPPTSALPAAKARRAYVAVPAASPRSVETLRFDNGYGGFSGDGREYVVRLKRGRDGTLTLPPMPWSNVLANERFGTVVTEKGAASTWGANSRLHRLTPWRNDPLADPHGEAFYLRDAESGAFWSVLPGPAPGADCYEVRHGFGYTRWQHTSAGLEHEVTLFVADRDPVRVLSVAIKNPSEKARRLSFYSFNRWVLGTTPSATSSSVTVEFDATRAAVLARNPAAGVFATGIAFAALAGPGAAQADACTDRAAFLGVPGFMDAPAALESGAALVATPGGEPAAALRMEIFLAPGAQLKVQALLGEAASETELDRLLGEYRVPRACEAALEQVTEAWSERLGRTQIETPDPAIDLMVNGWLVYQTIACRLWARTAFYQSGGAFGFRDQLQDAAALAHNHPDFLRRQILNNAAHQFAEGDVLHWWHPPRGDGIRTRFADDLVWLPYLTARYVAVTGDAALLREFVAFKRGPALEADEDERYIVPEESEAVADLYTHCVLAFERAMTKGANGLPLFGCGDWNDGMNRVGREGRGESVWMAFFLYTAIEDFLPLCRSRGDTVTSARLTAYQADLGRALESAAWDGEWYRRGYYDNGKPLGSALSDDCQIDALVQAWAVISNAVPRERAEAALAAAERRLVSDDDRLVRLLAPPFVDTAEDPGYIKGYLAGVRENGGQYTHAALWLVKAFAEAGHRNRAAGLLSMLSPVTHSSDATRCAVYQVEPYVVAADVYGVAPHVGRGGWTWYTGSAGWMYRVALESILGFTLEGGTALRFKPCIPDGWRGFALRHRRPDGTSYRIAVVNARGASEHIVSATLDGEPVPLDGGSVRIEIAIDCREHEVRIELGAATR